MELDDLQDFLAQSPTARLLRAQNGAFILHFLFLQFKKEQRITIPQDQLLADLTDYQATVREKHPDALGEEPLDYLNAWCKPDTRYLQRFFQGSSEEPVYQLTAHTEAALRFARESVARDDQFVGAESRVLAIVETLREIDIFSGEDADSQVAALEEERDKVQAEIDRIRQSGDAKTYDRSQIRERFHFAIDLLQRVLSDFRKVEDKFKEITREVQDLQIAGENKGDLLEFVMNSESVLKESDQGKSFYGFVNLILSPTRQRALRELIESVRRIHQVEDNEEELEMLRNMIPALTAEAEQVMQTNQRLSSSIRRFLDGRVADERRQVALTIEEVLNQARQARNAPPEDSVGLEVEEGFRPYVAFSRSFWSPAAEVDAVALEVAEAGSDELDEAFDLFSQMRRLDWKGMRELIGNATKLADSVSLPRLLEDHPPESGAVEVLAYVQIAQDDDHVIIPEEMDEIVLPDDLSHPRKRVMRVPRVVFRSTVNA